MSPTGLNIRPDLDLDEHISDIAEVYRQAEADAVVSTAGSPGKEILQVDEMGAVKTMEAPLKLVSSVASCWGHVRG